jgi:hypothetical protein
MQDEANTPPRWTKIIRDLTTLMVVTAWIFTARVLTGMTSSQSDKTT